MGRPLNRRFFGNPTSAGKQLVVTEAWIPGAASASPTNSVWVVKQISSYGYRVTNGTYTGEVHLQAGPVTAPGQARIRVMPFGGVAEYARTIRGKIVKTFAGKSYGYSATTPADAPNKADILFA